MSCPLPSLEEPEPGTACPRCQSEVRLSAPLFCSTCYEQAMHELEVMEEARQRALRRDHEQARKRARTWQLGRAAQQ